MGAEPQQGSHPGPMALRAAGGVLPRAGGVVHFGLKRGPLSPASAPAAPLSSGMCGTAPKSPGSPEVPVSKRLNAGLGLYPHCPGDPGAGSLPPKGDRGTQTFPALLSPPQCRRGRMEPGKVERDGADPAGCHALPRAACTCRKVRVAKQGPNVMWLWAVWAPFVRQ